MLPFLIILEAYGLEALFQFSKKYKNKIQIGILTLLILNFSYFLYMYFDHSVSHEPYISKYDKIIVTDFPDSIYPWYAFFTGKDPADFNKTYKENTNERDYGNVVFSEEKCPSDENPVKYEDKKILMIDSWECPYQSQIHDGAPLKVIGNITRPDGSEVYALLSATFVPTKEQR